MSKRKNRAVIYEESNPSKFRRLEEQLRTQWHYRNTQIRYVQAPERSTR